MDRLTRVNDYEALSNEPLFSQMVQRLKQYEDAEEQGKIIMTAWEIGTFAYVVDADDILYGEVCGVGENESYIVYCSRQWYKGKEIFCSADHGWFNAEYFYKTLDEALTAQNKTA